LKRSRILRLTTEFHKQPWSRNLAKHGSGRPRPVSPWGSIKRSSPLSRVMDALFGVHKDNLNENVRWRSVVVRCGELGLPRASSCHCIDSSKSKQGGSKGEVKTNSPRPGLLILDSNIPASVNNIRSREPSTP
jgi:hypothetical protein